jgi:hypothetical protein
MRQTKTDPAVAAAGFAAVADIFPGLVRPTRNSG